MFNSIHRSETLRGRNITFLRCVVNFCPNRNTTIMFVHFASFQLNVFFVVKLA